MPDHERQLVFHQEISDEKMNDIFLYSNLNGAMAEIQKAKSAKKEDFKTKEEYQQQVEFLIKEGIEFLKSALKGIKRT